MKTVWLERRPRRTPRLEHAGWRPALQAVLRGASAALFASLAFAGDVRGEPARPRNEVVFSVSVDNARGRLLCAVYERSGWLKRPVRGSTAAFRGKVATCRFPDLKPGTYATGAFQDENSNGKLDRGFMGTPAEPWCVSRGPRGTLGPPSFDAAKFSVGDGTVRVNCSAR